MAEQATQEPVTATATTPAAVPPAAPLTAPPDSVAGSLLGGAPAEPATGETKPDPAPEKPVVPEKYEFKAPEGMVLDEAGIESFTPVAKELGLSNEQAQKLVDLYGSRMSEQFAEIQKQQAEALQKQQAAWAEEFKADKEMGGAKFEESIWHANRSLAQFATPEEVKSIQAAGLGNYPPLVKMLARISQQVGKEGSFHQGQPRSLEQRAAQMFPNSK